MAGLSVRGWTAGAGAVAVLAATGAWAIAQGAVNTALWDKVRPAIETGLAVAAAENEGGVADTVDAAAGPGASAGTTATPDTGAKDGAPADAGDAPGRTDGTGAGAGTGEGAGSGEDAAGGEAGAAGAPVGARGKPGKEAVDPAEPRWFCRAEVVRLTQREDDAEAVVTSLCAQYAVRQDALAQCAGSAAPRVVHLARETDGSWKVTAFVEPPDGDGYAAWVHYHLGTDRVEPPSAEPLLTRARDRFGLPPTAGAAKVDAC